MTKINNLIISIFVLQLHIIFSSGILEGQVFSVKLSSNSCPKRRKSNIERTELSGFIEVGKTFEDGKTWILRTLERGKNGTLTAWQNIKDSQAIRKRLKAGESIQYKEFMLMSQEKEDREKIFSTVINAVCFSNMFPILLLMNPTMLPSTFQDPSKYMDTYKEQSVNRLAAISEGLAEIEKLASIEKNENRRAEFKKLRKEIASVLSCTSIASAFGCVEKYCLANPEKATQQADLWKMPKPVYLALWKSFGLVKQFYPRFAVDFSVRAHLEKVSAGDEILQKVPIEALSRTERNWKFKLP